MFSDMFQGLKKREYQNKIRHHKKTTNLFKQKKNSLQKKQNLELKNIKTLITTPFLEIINRKAALYKQKKKLSYQVHSNSQMKSKNSIFYLKFNHLHNKQNKLKNLKIKAKYANSLIKDIVFTID